MPPTDRLTSQIRFLLEIDRLKQVLRQTLLVDGSRQENSAEHSWMLAMLAIVLAEHAATPGLDISRVLKMVVLHDVVEVDAGDSLVYDAAAMATKHAREQRAADRIFGLLPEDQGRELRGLWEEMEARQTPEARFAEALDRFDPMLHNYVTQGVRWRHHGVTARQVIALNEHIAEGAPALWAYMKGLIEDAVAKGWLRPG